MNNYTPKPGAPTQRVWTTDQVMQRLGLSNPQPLYQAKAKNEAYQKGEWLAIAAGPRNRWLFCRILPSPQRH